MNYPDYMPSVESKLARDVYQAGRKFVDDGDLLAFTHQVIASVETADQIRDALQQVAGITDTYIERAATAYDSRYAMHTRVKYGKSDVKRECSGKYCSLKANYQLPNGLTVEYFCKRCLDEAVLRYAIDEVMPHYREEFTAVASKIQPRFSPFFRPPLESWRLRSYLDSRRR